jgi:hypothetical protein
VFGEISQQRADHCLAQLVTREPRSRPFLALVEKRFKAADPDNDGTIDAKELKGPAGRSLVRLLK